MTDNELQKVLNAIKYIPSENERDEVTQIILKAASESITLDSRLSPIRRLHKRLAESQEANCQGDYLQKLRQLAYEKYSTEIRALPRQRNNEKRYSGLSV